MAMRWWSESRAHQPTLVSGALVDMNPELGLYRSWEMADHDRNNQPGVFPCGGGASAAGELSFGHNGVVLVSMDTHILEYAARDGRWRALSW